MKAIYNRLSIASKIIIVSAILAAIFLGASFGYAVLAMRTQLTNAIRQASLQQVQLEVSRVNSQVLLTRKTMLALAKTPPIQGIIRARDNDGYDAIDTSTYDQWTQRLAAIFSAEISSQNIYTQLRYIDEHGQELVRVDNINETPIRKSENELQNKSNRGYFTEAMRTEPNEVYVSRAGLNREGDPPQISIPYQPVIRYAVPIFAENSEVRRGIIIANVSVEKLAQTSNATAGPSESIYAIDADGYYILHPQPDHMWGGPEDLNTGFNFYSDYPDISPAALSENVGSFIHGNNLFIYAKINPQYATVKKHWLAIKRIPLSSVYAPVDRIAEISLIIGIATFIILFFVFLFAIQKLLSPLKQLTQAATNIGEGHFDQKVQINTKDELGKLAVAFNNMTTKLKESYGFLEQKVQERTRQLEEKLQETERLNKIMVNRELKMKELKEQIKQTGKTYNSNE